MKDTDSVALYQVVYCAVVWKVYYTGFISRDAVSGHPSHRLEQTWRNSHLLTIHWILKTMAFFLFQGMHFQSSIDFSVILFFPLS